MVIDKELIDGFVAKASVLLADNPIKADLEQQFKALLQSNLSKLDLVSREEFDIQAQVLARTRAKIDALEQQLQALSAELEQARQNNAQ